MLNIPCKGGLNISCLFFSNMSLTKSSRPERVIKNSNHIYNLPEWTVSSRRGGREIMLEEVLGRRVGVRSLSVLIESDDGWARSADELFFFFIGETSFLIGEDGRISGTLGSDNISLLLKPGLDYLVVRTWGIKKSSMRGNSQGQIIRLQLVTK